VLSQFEHLLGLTLAIYNQGLRTWLLRGDAELGRWVFKTLGEAWRTMFKLSEEMLVSEGISKELREFAMKYCESTRKYLKSYASKDWQDCCANVYAFNFIVKSRAKPTSNDVQPAKRAKKGDSTKRVLKDATNHSAAAVPQQLQEKLEGQDFAEWQAANGSHDKVESKKPEDVSGRQLWFRFHDAWYSGIVGKKMARGKDKGLWEIKWDSDCSTSRHRLHSEDYGGTNHWVVAHAA